MNCSASRCRTAAICWPTSSARVSGAVHSPATRSRRETVACVVTVAPPAALRRRRGRSCLGERTTSKRRPCTVNSTCTSGITAPGSRSVVTSDSADRPPGTVP